MEIKTKFNIDDKVYYIGRIYESGITVDKYVIDDLKIHKGLKDEIMIQYSIRNPKKAQDHHSVYDEDIYALNELDKVLEIIKEKMTKGE